jgi:hypothetical protein
LVIILGDAPLKDCRASTYTPRFFHACDRAPRLAPVEPGGECREISQHLGAASAYPDTTSTGIKTPDDSVVRSYPTHFSAAQRNPITMK